MYIVIIFSPLIETPSSQRKSVLQKRFVPFNTQAFTFAEFNALEFTYYNPVFYHKVLMPLITAR